MLGTNDMLGNSNGEEIHDLLSVCGSPPTDV